MIDGKMEDGLEMMNQSEQGRNSPRVRFPYFCSQDGRSGNGQKVITKATISVSIPVPIQQDTRKGKSSQMGCKALLGRRGRIIC